MSGIVVTTGVKSGARERELAKAVATELGAPFVPRGGRSPEGGPARLLILETPS